MSTISPCPSFCGGFGGAFDLDSDGGEGFTSSFSSLNNVDGNGRAQAVFVGPSLLPELSAEAFSNAESAGVRSSRVASQATGMQQYIYSGPSSTLSMTAAFDGTVTGDGDITGSLVVARASGGADVPMSRDYGTLVFEILALDPNLESLGNNQSVLSATGTDLLSVTFGVNDGDSIFVWADLIAAGIRGGTADSFNTMTLAFSDPTGFAPQLVPVPAAFWLFGSGMIGLIGVARRKKS